MAVDVQGRKLYMADFEKTGELTGSSSDYEGRIIRTNLDGSQAEVLINEPGIWAELQQILHSLYMYIYTYTIIYVIMYI